MGYNLLATSLNSSYSLKHEKRRLIKLKKKMTLMVIGVILILIALILGALQHFYYGTLPNNQNIYGNGSNKWYFYILVGIVGLIGIILVAWSLIIVEVPAKTTQPTEPTK